MRLLRAKDYRRMPWKNGGGETAEMIVSPDGASLDDFGWRISMATVASDGPFSPFPNIDRTLTLLEGKGLILHVEGRIPDGMMRKLSPLSFPGDVPCRGQLIGGAITDLNVMTRRGRFAHEVIPARLTEPFLLPVESDILLIFAAGGDLQARVGGGDVLLAKHDLLVLSAEVGQVEFVVESPVDILMIEISAR